MAATVEKPNPKVVVALKAKADADKAAFDIAKKRADKTGALVPAVLAAERVTAAELSLEMTTTKLQANPTDRLLQILRKAWQETLTSVQNAEIVQSDKPSSERVSTLQAAEKSWFVRPVVGPIPGYGVVLGSAGVAGLGWLAVKKRIFQRIFGG